MCNILGVVFTKNGSQSIPGCTSTTTDRIDIDIIVQVLSTEINKYITANATWRRGATSFDGWSPVQYITSSGIYDFIVSVPVSTVGTYTISSVFVNNNTDNVVICNTTSSQVCNTLTVTSSCNTPTCNFAMT